MLKVCLAQLMARNGAKATIRLNLMEPTNQHRLNCKSQQSMPHIATQDFVNSFLLHRIACSVVDMIIKIKARVLGIRVQDFMR